ncbi:hypothetical protein ACP4OV_022509 [Aristida adscensionis]
MSRREELLAKVALECGDISASQEELLARSSFLGGGGGEEAEVFSTPPLTQDHHQQQQAQDGIAMSTQPFSPSSAEESAPPKRRICTRKIRGARIRTPTPSPVRGGDTPTPIPIPDPLCRAVLMIPTRKSKTGPGTEEEDDILELARKRGIFF